MSPHRPEIRRVGSHHAILPDSQRLPEGLPPPLAQALSHVIPFFMFVDCRGQVCDHGPSIAKLLGHVGLKGRYFQRLFQFDRIMPQSMALIAQISGGDLKGLRPISQPELALRGTITQLATGKDVEEGKEKPAGWLINLSCGPAMSDLLRRGVLCAADFAATDMAVDMLYLTEAKSAAMAASMRLNRRLQGAKTQAEHLASTDTLTGLSNRRILDETLARACGQQAGFSLIHMDLDYFKRVNDSLGHAAGDFVLQEVAKILRRALRSEDTIVRYGGDEFVLILQHTLARDDLAGIAARLISDIGSQMTYQGQPCGVSASLGIKRIPAGTVCTPAQVLRDADTALYAAKHAGRSCFRFHEAGGGRPSEGGLISCGRMSQW